MIPWEAKRLEVKVLGSSSSGNCYIISTPDNSLMIECGLNIARIKKGGGFKIHEIDGCLISHEH